jgi:ubiquinol-cytochrome c reductase cytochrome c subunit
VNSLTARRRRPGATVVVLLLALLATGGLYAFLAPTNDAEATGAADGASVEDGRALFLSNCATCHGLNAEGSSDGPSLVGVGAASVDFQVGTGRMPAAKPEAQAPAKKVVFDDKEIAALAAFVASLGPGPAVPSAEQVDTEGAKASEGGEIFRTNCAMCHNFAGAGGALTHGKYAPSLDKVSAKHIYEAMLTGPQSMPVFSDRQLPEEDKQAVIAWLENVREEPSPGGFTMGKLGPVTEGAFGWIVGIGLLIGCAVWLGAKSS